jgi:hypothetical protein
MALVECIGPFYELLMCLHPLSSTALPGAQVVRALSEAESFPGPSLVLAYAPCQLQGLRDGMCTALEEAKLAVSSGYWPLYRYDPRKARHGDGPLQVGGQQWRQPPQLPRQRFEDGDVEMLAFVLKCQFRWSDFSRLGSPLVCRLCLLPVHLPLVGRRSAYGFHSMHRGHCWWVFVSLWCGSTVGQIDAELEGTLACQPARC